MIRRAARALFGVCALPCLGGCASRPLLAPSAPPPSASTTASAAGACGGFEQRALSEKRHSLLGDRLFVRAPAGLEDRPPPTDVMSAEASEETETRLFLNAGGRKVVVFAEELFARPGPDLERFLRENDRRLAGARFESITLGGGLRAVLVTHPTLKAPNDVVPVAHAYTVLPDDTVQVTHFFVNPEVVRAGSDGCVALARKVLGTLEPGPRRLELRGGERRLGNGYSLRMPEASVLVTERGEDFVVFRVVPVVPLGARASELGIYFGGHPSFSKDPTAKEIPGTLAEKATTWYETTEHGAIRREALVELEGGGVVHAFLGTTTAADADVLTEAAATLRRIPP